MMGWSPENNLGREIFFLAGADESILLLSTGSPQDSLGQICICCVSSSMRYTKFLRYIHKDLGHWMHQSLPRGTKAFKCAYKHMYYCGSRAFTQLLKVRTFMCWLDMHCAGTQTFSSGQNLIWADSNSGVTVKFTRVSSFNYLVRA